MIGDEAEIFIWISPLRGILGGSEEDLPTGLQKLVYIICGRRKNLGSPQMSIFKMCLKYDSLTSIHKRLFLSDQMQKSGSAESRIE